MTEILERIEELKDLPFQISDEITGQLSLVAASHAPWRWLLDAFTSVALSQLPAHMKNKPDQWVVDTDIKI